MTLLELVVIGWLPGAILFRLPYARREVRAAIPAEERVFWAVLLSLATSLAVVMGLAYIHRYSVERLIVADVLIAAGLAALARFDLKLGPTAPKPGAGVLLAIALIGLGCWRFFPPSEYVIGGKDPGVYVAEGIQIAQRGTLVYHDPVVASVPPFARDLFFPSHERSDYYGIRFMGFFITNPQTGAVVGQFPHLFPASIAIGYGIRGLSGAREAVSVWAVLGLLAVYFLARRAVGTPAAFAAAALLSLHVIEVWFARYPNAEMVMQTLVFAGLLASVRAHADEDAFFAPVAGLMLGLLLFLRFDAVLAIAGVAAGLVLIVLQRRTDSGVARRHRGRRGARRHPLLSRPSPRLHRSTDRLSLRPEHLALPGDCRSCRRRAGGACRRQALGRRTSAAQSLSHRSC